MENKVITSTNESVNEVKDNKSDTNAKTCCQRNYFACNCGMIFIFRERILVDDIYLCKTCHVHNLDVL